MTTLNTIIEEENTPDTEWEKKATDAIIATYPEDIWPEPEYKPHDAEVSWVMRQMSKAIASILKPVVEDLLTSRDTYWKERVRKEVEGMDIVSTSYECGVGYRQAKHDILQALDNLK